MTTFDLLKAQDPQELLHKLKDLKNSLIGNVPRKVDVARDGRTIVFLRDQLDLNRISQGKSTAIPTSPLLNLEIANESAVILSSFASVGTLVLAPLLLTQCPSAITASLKSCVHIVDAASNFEPKPGSDLGARSQSYIAQKLIPSLCKALRNIFHAAGGFVYGPMTGVGMEVEVVRTGWVAEGGETADVEMMDEANGSGIDKGQSKGKNKEVYDLAERSICWLYEPENASILCHLITSTAISIPATLLPIYQLLAQLTLLPSQRATLVAAIPTPVEALPHVPSLSFPDSAASSHFPVHTPVATFAGMLAANNGLPSVTSSGSGSTSQNTSSTGRSFLIAATHEVQPCLLIISIVKTIMVGRANVKVKQAGLDLLSSLTRDERGHALQVFKALKLVTQSSTHEAPVSSSLAKGFECLHPLVDMMESRTNGLTASAITCLANILKALPLPSASRSPNPSTPSSPSGNLPVDVFPSLVYLFGQGQEEQIRATFTLTYLISRSAALQARANEADCIKHVLQAVKSMAEGGYDITINSDSRTRLLEGSYLCLAALALGNETSRAAIVEADLLPQLRTALSHPSYGLRASACQVVRAISRSSAILRTSLVDSGVSEQLFKLLKEEEQSSNEVDLMEASPAGERRRDTVLVAATATICNLITEFSPVQTAMIELGAIETLVRLCNTTSTAVRVNALWALRNMLYKNDMKTKRRVMECLSWNGLKALGFDPSPDVQEQAFALLRNTTSEATDQELSFVWNGFGEGELFDFLSLGLSRTAEPESLEQALYVIHNIALGSKMYRDAVLSRPQTLSAMSRTLYHDSPLVLVAALGALVNLVEPNDKHNRASSSPTDALPTTPISNLRYTGSRQDAVHKLKHLNLEARLRLLSADPTFDVRSRARHLLEQIESPGGGR